MKTNRRYVRRLKLTDYELRVAINALNAHRLKQKSNPRESFLYGKHHRQSLPPADVRRYPALHPVPF